MAEKPTNTISLKLYINTQDNKVLFAGVSKDFVDFLLHMLSLPLASANKLMREQGMMVGSISYLYSSVESLDGLYIQPNQTKDSILNPVLFHANNYDSYAPLLLPKNWISLNEKKLFKCPSCYYVCDAVKYCHSHAINQKPWVVYEPQLSINSSNNHTSVESLSEEGGFVKGIVNYIVMDNLELKPMSDISIIKQLLDELNLKNLSLLQEKVVEMSMDEAMMVLKASMQSQTVLTDVFLTNMKSKQCLMDCLRYILRSNFPTFLIRGLI